MTDDREKPAPTPDDDAIDREAILARRARFVATALVGITVLPACDPTPHPCLNIAPAPTASSTSPSASAAASASAPDAGNDDAGAPQPCLEIAPPPPSASASSSASSGASETPTPPKPQPCLSVIRDPSRPAPCLSPPVRKPDSK